MSPVSANKQALETATAEATAENAKRTGKGTRVKVGQTRGKNPSVITWEAFDLEKPDSLPTDIKEFMEVTKINDQKEILGYIIDGFNGSAYSQASDEIGEYINDSWDKETQSQFRLAVRNYSKLAGVGIEDAVNLIKPGLEKAFQAKLEAAKQPATV